jgi:hypothetical protein
MCRVRFPLRPLPQTRLPIVPLKNRPPVLRRFLLLSVLLTVGACTLGCGGGGAGSVTPPSPPTTSLHHYQRYAGKRDSAAAWNTQLCCVRFRHLRYRRCLECKQIPGGSPQVGTISADGLYTAPADLPPGATVQVTATNHADSSKSSTARVTISSDVAVSVSPGSSVVELGGTQTFHASIASSGHPDSTVHWTLSGSACPTSCGTIDASGNYTAPLFCQALPLSTSRQPASPIPPRKTPPASRSPAVSLCNFLLPRATRLDLDCRHHDASTRLPSE